MTRLRRFAIPAAAALLTVAVPVRPFAADAQLVFTVAQESLSVSAGEMISVSVAENHGSFALEVELPADATGRFAAVTQAHIGETMTVTLCGRPILDAVIRERIVSGRFRVVADSAAQADAWQKEISTGHCG